MAWTIIHFSPQPPLLKHALFLTPNAATLLSASQNFNLSPKAHIFKAPLSPSHKPHIQTPVICARKRKTPSGSKKLSKLLTEVAVFMVSNLRMLPEPLDLVIREFSGGEGRGGGLGLLKDSGGGRFGGWRRKGRRMSGFMGFFLMCGLVALVLFGSSFKTWLFHGLSAFCLLGTVLLNGRKIRVKDCVLGVCLMGALVGLGFKREDMRKWLGRAPAGAPVLVLMNRKQKK